MEIFRDDGQHTKKVYPSFWNDLSKLFSEGIVISHIEVFKEIEPGDDLHVWAHNNKSIFWDYDCPAETKVIQSMTTHYKDFVNAKIKAVHADPWLIAQAKVKNLKIITQEMRSSTIKPNKLKIPDVCADPNLNIPCINLMGLMRERGWTY